MEYHDFRLRVETAAKAAGLTDYELFYQKSRSQTIGAFHGEIDGFNLGDSIGVCFRCVIDGKPGYASTERMEEDEAEALVAAAVDSARYVEIDEPEFLYRQTERAELVEAPREADVQTQMDAILTAERDVLAADERIKTIGGAKLMSGVSEKGIFNSYGVDKVASQQYYGWYVVPVASVGEKTYSDMGFQIAEDFGDLDEKALVGEAVSRTLSRVGAGTVASGKYRIVLDRDVVADFLATFDSVFSSEAAQKGLSLFKGREGEAVAASCVTLLDDPFCPGAVFHVPFDDEGVAGQRKALIEGGVLKTLLYNLKTAAKEGKVSTGNAYKAGLSARVTVAPTNLYLEPGENTLDELFAMADGGIFVTEIAGMHASADAISGDFSLESKGFRIVDGKRGAPIELFTIAGNFFQLLKDVEAVGNDLRFGFPTGAGQIGTPSLLVKSLTVAGD